MVVSACSPKHLLSTSLLVDLQITVSSGMVCVSMCFPCLYICVGCLHYFCRFHVCLGFDLQVGKGGRWMVKRGLVCVRGWIPLIVKCISRILARFIFICCIHVHINVLLTACCIYMYYYPSCFCYLFSIYISFSSQNLRSVCFVVILIWSMLHGWICLVPLLVSTGLLGFHVTVIMLTVVLLVSVLFVYSVTVAMLVLVLSVWLFVLCLS